MAEMFHVHRSDVKQASVYGTYVNGCNYPVRGLESWFLVNSVRKDCQTGRFLPSNLLRDLITGTKNLA